jgi:hypothetical protein
VVVAWGLQGCDMHEDPSKLNTSRALILPGFSVSLIGITKGGHLIQQAHCNICPRTKELHGKSGFTVSTGDSTLSTMRNVFLFVGLSLVASLSVVHADACWTP